MAFDEDAAGARVKFACSYLGNLAEWRRAAGTSGEQRQRFDAQLPAMATALQQMEQRGAAPVAADGRVAGNAAAALARRGDQLVMLVSRSGKQSGQLDPERDFCVVPGFDAAAWSCGYYAAGPDVQPTSDTPLHFAALLESRSAAVSLHGHEFETAAKAATVNVPCSLAETLFSTPEDAAELVGLMRRCAYPRHRMYVRRGHGFVILGSSFPQALALLDAKLHMLRVGHRSKRQWLLAAAMCLVLSTCVALLLLRTDQQRPPA